MNCRGGIDKSLSPEKVRKIFGKENRKPYNYNSSSGNSSVGRAQPCQGWGREFESRFPLRTKSPGHKPGLFLFHRYHIPAVSSGNSFALEERNLIVFEKLFLQIRTSCCGKDTAAGCRFSTEKKQIAVNSSGTYLLYFRQTRVKTMPHKAYRQPCCLYRLPSPSSHRYT